jgi:hypothetical protein
VSEFDALAMAYGVDAVQVRGLQMLGELTRRRHALARARTEALEAVERQFRQAVTGYIALEYRREFIRA